MRRSNIEREEQLGDWKEMAKEVARLRSTVEEVTSKKAAGLSCLFAAQHTQTLAMCPFTPFDLFRQISCLGCAHVLLFCKSTYIHICACPPPLDRYLQMPTACSSTSAHAHPSVLDILLVALAQSAWQLLQVLTTPAPHRRQPQRQQFLEFSKRSFQCRFSESSAQCRRRAGRSKKKSGRNSRKEGCER